MRFPILCISKAWKVQVDVCVVSSNCDLRSIVTDRHAIYSSAQSAIVITEESDEQESFKLDYYRRGATRSFDDSN